MNAVLGESEFDRLADETLNRLLQALADLEHEDLDVELESGVLRLSFTDGSKYVINSHRAARQIWMAADAHAWHFNWDKGAWRCSKSNAELWQQVRTHVGKKLGQPLVLGLDLVT